jgi:hypothetical protein
MNQKLFSSCQNGARRENVAPRSGRAAPKFCIRKYQDRKRSYHERDRRSGGRSAQAHQASLSGMEEDCKSVAAPLSLSLIGRNSPEKRRRTPFSNLMPSLSTSNKRGPDKSRSNCARRPS